MYNLYLIKCMHMENNTQTIGDSFIEVQNAVHKNVKSLTRR